MPQRSNWVMTHVYKWEKWVIKEDGPWFSVFEKKHGEEVWRADFGSLAEAKHYCEKYS